MLALTRLKGERIFIGKEITVAILDIGDNWVRIGINAPPDILVLREELIEEGQDWKGERRSNEG